MLTGIALNAWTRVSAQETPGDYCMGQERYGQSFDECMRQLEQNQQNMGLLGMVVVGGVIAAVYFYNKGRRDEAEKA